MRISGAAAIMTANHAPSMPSAAGVRGLMAEFGVSEAAVTGGGLAVRSPINGALIAEVKLDGNADYESAVEGADAAFRIWRRVPAPKRGELVRLFGEELRARKALLGQLIAIESGKILQEGLGEVQEMIDICGFAAGLSRQLYGLTMPSERPGHRMMETWHPLGVTGVITAFNFPMAVWAWNAAIALVCGDTLVWKPSEKAPLCALACQALLARTAKRLDMPPGIAAVVLGGPELGEALAADPRVPLVSATGSARMGHALAPKIAQRFGRAILELGGNNGAIVTPSADLALAARAILFAAAGTAGQRCTSLRRLFLHESVYDELMARLRTGYAQIAVGNPLAEETLVGPLIGRAAFESMQKALSEARRDGAAVTGGERLYEDQWPEAFYVRPAIAEMPRPCAVVARETFAPILYVMHYRELAEAIREHNAVPQGLASSIFTNDVREAELFMSGAGSDCGIVNVNVGPSGAEIGGAFGGEKETGGGREAGSDAWKTYMRRATNTVNFSQDLPLAQGIRFEALG